MVEYLTQLGLQPSLKDMFGHTPVDIACMHRHASTPLLAAMKAEAPCPPRYQKPTRTLYVEEKLHYKTQAPLCLLVCWLDCLFACLLSCLQHL